MPGQGEMKYAGGFSYKGQYCMGKKHGNGVYKWPNGKIYDGGWHLGKKSG